MIYRIDSQLFQNYPGYVRGLVIARRVINIEPPIDEVARMLTGAQKTIRARTDLDPLSAHPNIAAWREAYRVFGAKPTDYPSAIEALVKRVRRGDASASLSAGLPYINTLAALGNSASLRYLAPIGGHAIDTLQADDELVLGYAQGTEEFTPLGGGPIEHPLPGEVIFYVTSPSRAVLPHAVPQVMTRRWTWRQGEFTKLQRTTTQVVINIDGLPPVTRADVETISTDVATLVGMYCGGASVEIKLLSEDNPVVEL
ncbi:MAG TPA: phenylalanine--tRNA ligase beta subunit-related protein [Anaerolineae bacterium]|nr:phenylalanine--tRNA ligase beta subunit-related protein [Anaerolineae bacterium]